MEYAHQKLPNRNAALPLDLRKSSAFPVVTRQFLRLRRHVTSFRAHDFQRQSRKSLFSVPVKQSFTANRWAKPEPNHLSRNLGLN